MVVVVDGGPGRCHPWVSLDAPHPATIDHWPEEGPVGAPPWIPIVRASPPEGRHGFGQELPQTCAAGDLRSRAAHSTRALAEPAGVVGRGSVRQQRGGSERLAPAKTKKKKVDRARCARALPPRCVEARGATRGVLSRQHDSCLAPRLIPSRASRQTRRDWQEHHPGVSVFVPFAAPPPCILSTLWASPRSHQGEQFPPHP